MCIIVAKNKGISLPSKETLQTCFERNSDGAGFMYVENGKVIIDKGYMDFKSFYKRLSKIEKRIGNLKDHALIMHFRIGTQGNNDKATTHPFPISNKVEYLKATYFKTDIGMVHNGILYSYNYDKTISDTQLFIKDFVSVFKELNCSFYKNKRVMDLICKQANISSNKLCFLDKDENIYYYGDKVEDNGVIYSNSTFKKITYTYSNSYRYYYDYYDWDYDYYKTKETKKENKPKTKKDLKQYEILDEGDFYQTLNGADFVSKNETIIVDRDKNLYELNNDKLSLIGTEATIYDKDWKEKELKFKGDLKW